MLVFYCAYYLLDFSFAVVWWSSKSLYNSVVFLNSRFKRIEDTPIDSDYIVIESSNDIKKELIELRQLILKNK